MDGQIPNVESSNAFHGNVQTRHKHRIEVWWQIIFPLLLVVALIFGGAYLIAAGEAGSLGRMAQVAVMLLALPLLVLGLLLLVLFVTAIYGIAQLMSWIPPRTFQVQLAIDRFTHSVLRLADLAAEPIIRIESAAGAVRRAFGRED